MTHTQKKTHTHTRAEMEILRCLHFNKDTFDERWDKLISNKT